MPAPVAPYILAFLPYATHGRIVGAAYADALAHTDTEYTVEDASGTQIVAPTQTGSADTVIDLPTQAFTVGELYNARLRYYNSAGSGAWSPWYAARARSRTVFTATPLATPGEPLDAATVKMPPVEPDYVSEPQRARGVFQIPTSLGQVHRRLRYSGERWTSSMVWLNIDTATMTELVARIDAVIADETALQTSDAVHGQRFWWVHQGRRRVTQTEPGVWRVEIAAEQVLSYGPEFGKVQP